MEEALTMSAREQIRAKVVDCVAADSLSMQVVCLCHCDSLHFRRSLVMHKRLALRWHHRVASPFIIR